MDVAIKPAKSRLFAAWKFVVISAVAIWIGGITFYGSVVIPIGSKILGSHLAFGFITQRVTGILNIIASFALAILLLNARMASRPASSRLRAILLGTWLIMAIIQIELFILHPPMDRMMDPHSHTLLDPHRFAIYHRAYLWSTTLQWFAAIVHLWGIVLAW